MACREGTLGDLGNDVVVLVRVTSKGKIVLRKGSIPLTHHAVSCVHIMSWSLVFESGHERTIMDDWFCNTSNDMSLFEGTVRLAVIHEYTNHLPRIIFCLLHPGVRPMTANFENTLEVYRAILTSGMLPNELRGFLGDELNRNDFYTVFHELVPTFSPVERARFLHGCLDLCISTLVFRHGSESAEAVTSFLFSADGPMDRHSRLMVSYDGIRMGPFTIDMMQNAKYPKRNMPMFDIKPPAQRKQYFQAIVKPKGEQNQSPSDKTVFVAAGITRVSRGQMTPKDTAPLLVMGIEVTPTLSPSRQENAGQNLKCRVMVMFTVDVPKGSPEVVERFHLAAQNILQTLRCTNMASKGPVQHILAVNGTIQQAVEAGFAMYKSGCCGIQLKWQAMHMPPHHFKVDETPTMRCILDPLADRCIELGTQNIAEIVLRFLHGRLSNALCRGEEDLGIEALLAVRIIRKLMQKMMDEVEEFQDPDEDVLNVTYSTDFLKSFVRKLHSIYKPEDNGGWTLGNVIARHSPEEVALKCDIDITEALVTPTSPSSHPEMLYFRHNQQNFFHFEEGTDKKRKTQGKEPSKRKSLKA